MRVTDSNAEPIHRVYNGRPIALTTSGLVQGLADLTEIARKLDRQGFSIICARLHGWPEIEVMPNRLCHEVMKAGEAEYFFSSNEEKRAVMFAEASSGQRVRVIWMERRLS